jgi:hypothetical protein
MKVFMETKNIKKYPRYRCAHKTCILLPYSKNTKEDKNSKKILPLPGTITVFAVMIELPMGMDFNGTGPRPTAHGPRPKPGNSALFSGP